MMVHPVAAESMVHQHRNDLLHGAEQARLVRAARAYNNVPRGSLGSRVRAGLVSLAPARTHAPTRPTMVPASH